MRLTLSLSLVCITVVTCFAQQPANNEFPETGNVKVYTNPLYDRYYDLLYNAESISRLAVKSTGSGTLWLKDNALSKQVILEADAPSIFKGELIVGAGDNYSRARAFYVQGETLLDGATEIRGGLNLSGAFYGDRSFTLNQTPGGAITYQIVNDDDQTVARVESTVNGIGKLTLGNENGEQKVRLTAEPDVPSYIKNELIVGTSDSENTGKSLYVDGDTYFDGDFEVNGVIRTRKVTVEASPWPDYVFEPNYQLPSLTEVEAFILKNKHLPNVPSADQVKEKGVELGEMNRVLLQKIEELTLHMIEQEKKINKLEKQNQELIQLIKD